MKKLTVVTKSVEMDLVESGRKGVTNKQMLDAFKTQTETSNLIQLLIDYPEVFKSSVKYTPDAKKVELENLVRTYNDPNFTVVTGKKIRLAAQQTKIEEVKIEEPKVIVLDSYKNKNNAKMAEVASKIETLNEDEKIIVKEMVEKDLGITELAKMFGMTKDKAYNMLFRSKNSIYNRLSQAN